MSDRQKIVELGREVAKEGGYYCLPSKNEIWSAKVAHLMRHAGLFGAVIRRPATSKAS